MRSARLLKALPRWEKDPRTFNETLPHLGNFRLKVMNTTWWKPCIHQLLLYVGTDMHGKAVRQRQTLNARASRE